MKFILVVASLLVLATFISVTNSLDNGLARTPQMGWNSWNFFQCSVNETIVRAMADAMVSSGLAAAGYEYVNIDDCWAYSRDANGTIQPDPSTFPSGMAALADYVHSKGLKFGLYSDGGPNTCDHRPGSYGHEQQDADTYASWGVDYLKYDNCYMVNVDPRQSYPVMRDALNTSGRLIFFSMCEWGLENPATWAGPVGNSWRTTLDINDTWGAMVNNIDQNDEWWTYAGPGGWNDPDMLEVGNGGMTHDEYVSHFSVWAISKAPLLLGCDLSNMTQDTINILTNKEVIAINQDPLGVQGHKIISDNELEVWAGPLQSGSVVVLLWNRSDYTASITVTWDDLTWPSGNSVKVASVRDLWLHEDLGEYISAFTAAEIPTHASRMLIVTAVDDHIVQL